MVLPKSQYGKLQEEGPESLESIRRSRMLCGCQCENGVCKPETCQCSAEDIGCQVPRFEVTLFRFHGFSLFSLLQVDGFDEYGSSHPCSCSAETCGNPVGRIEFDVANVKNHCRMTILRQKHADQMVWFTPWAIPTAKVKTLKALVYQLANAEICTGEIHRWP